MAYSRDPSATGSTSEPTRTPRIAWSALASAAAWVVEHWDEVKDAAETVADWVKGDASASEAAAEVGAVAGSALDELDPSWLSEDCETRYAYLAAAYNAATGKEAPSRLAGFASDDPWAATFASWLADCDEFVDPPEGKEAAEWLASLAAGAGKETVSEAAEAAGGAEALRRGSGTGGLLLAGLGAALFLSRR